MVSHLEGLSWVQESPFLPSQNHRDNQGRHEPAVLVHFKMAAARWNWSNEMIEALINAITENKNLCEFNVVKFKADFFCAERAEWFGDFASGVMKGRNFSTSFINTALVIRKFDSHSSSIK